jgi:Holliday junction resolvase RusA-like endonuclease
MSADGWPPAPRGGPAARFSLSLPPSTNNLFVSRRDGKGRAKTSAYKAWEFEVGWETTLAWHNNYPQLQPIKKCAMLIEAPFDHKRDIDNLKPVPDLLKVIGVIVDDRWIEDYRIVRSTGDKLIVSIWKV